MRRHEIWTAAGGPGYAGKPRPLLILQDERIDAVSVTTCGFTSQVFEVREVRPLVSSSAGNGLIRDSCVMVDKIMTLPRRLIGQRLGSLSPDDSAEVDRALLLFLGLSV